MGTKDLTHQAIAQALSNGDPLTHDQRAALLGLVADDKRWQREYDKAVAELAAERERWLIALDPRRWTAAHSAAWHRNLPNTHAAFDALRSLTKSKLDAQR